MPFVLTGKKILKFIRNFLLWITGGILFLILLVYLLLKIPSVQQWAAHKTVSYLANKLDTKVELKHIDIKLFSRLTLDGLYIEDQNKDTLLYAGHFELNIGSINPFNQKIKLKNIDLEQAYINIYRNNPDTVFNYQFVADAFSSKKKKDTTSSKPLDLKLNSLKLADTRFIYHDEITSSDYNFNLQNVKVNINDLNFEDNIIALESISLDNSSIALTTLPYISIDTATSPENYDTVHIALGDWAFEANAIKMSNCAFYLKDENSTSTTTGINFSDLALTNINLDIEEIKYVGDSISATINELALKDKSGFEINHFTARLLFTPYQISLKSLRIQTPNSDIKDQFSMTFNTLNDFNRLFSDVRLQVELKNSVLSSKDIAYFSSSLAQYNISATINASAKGSLNNLKIKNLNAQVNKIGGIRGEITVKGLPNINETFIDAQINPLIVKTAQLESITGKLPRQITGLQFIDFKGRFTGFINDFVVFGNINSPAGNIVADLNFKYDRINDNAFYEGKVKTENLNAGFITGTENILGTVSLDARIKGSGLTLDKLSAELNATISNIEINQYNYTDITIGGKVANKFFEGNLTVNDPNLKQTFTGKFDLGSEIPTFDFDAAIQYANLGKLHLYNRNIEVVATANVDIEGKSVNDAVGNAKLTNVLLKDGNIIYTLDTLNISSLLDSAGRNLEIQSDIITASFKGDYQLDKFPLAVREMINVYLKGTQFTTIDSSAKENLTFEVKVNDAGKLFAIFYPSVQNFKNLTASGSINTNKKDFDMRALLEKLTWNGKDFNSIALQINTNDNKLNFFAKVKEVKIKNQLTIPVTSLEGDFSRDSLNVNLKIGRDTDAERLNLYVSAFIADSVIKLNVLPSEIYVENQKWDIQPNNSLQYRNKNLLADNFTLQNEDKILSLTSSVDPKYGSVLRFNLKNIPVQYITGLVKYNEPAFGGMINIDFTMSGKLSNPDFTGAASIQNFVIDKQQVGDINLTASLVSLTSQLNFNLTVNGNSTMRASGFYNIKTDSLLADADLNKIPLAIAEPFTTGLFSDMYGELYGNIKIRGTAKNLYTKGIIEIKKGGLKFDYLGSAYNFDYQKIEFEPGIIRITPNKIYDKYKDEGVLSGSITHKNFNNWYFDSLQIKSEKILFMETSQKDNPDFYGYAIGKADVTINGPLENLNVIVKAKPVKDFHKNSVIYIPTFGSGNVSKQNFIKFVNRSDTNRQVINENISYSVVNLYLYLDVTPDAEIQILLSGETPDVIVGRGFGNLFLEINTLGKVEISGILKVTEGSYYNFSLLNKKFIIAEGGTILFDGDPLRAQINLSAVYNATNVSLKDLVSDLPTSQQEGADRRVPVDVYINLTGTLEAPNIDFDIELPEQSSGSLSGVDQRLNQIKSDKNELNKQVVGLLMFNQFLPTNLGQTGVASGVGSTLTEFVANQLSTYFTDWITEILPNAEVDIGYTSYTTNDISLTQTQMQALDVGIKQKLLHDNVTIKIGGTYNYSQTSTSNDAASNLAGDFEVEYNITPDGRVRVKAFRKSAYDAISAKNDIKNGVGLFYTKDFNTLGELFKRNKKTGG